MRNTPCNKKCKQEEYGPDCSAEKTTERVQLELKLIGTVPRPKGKISSFSTTDDEGSELTHENENRDYYNRHADVTSSLVSYFKAISKFPLLS
ncbi:MAG: hypothetical protein R3339_03575 [Thermodesulfobacteriota bacterium]|nr:hypothetical protein [Thermodesulfobacteriota bacterium]